MPAKPEVKPVQRRNRQPAQQRKHELELARLNNNHELAMASVKYVMEDFDTQLLVVALTGTGIATALTMYNEYVASHVLPEDKPDEPPKDFLSWALAEASAAVGLVDSANKQAMGMLAKIAPLGGVAGLGFASLEGCANKDGWHGVIGAMIAGSAGVAGMAWALLFTRAVMGQAGLGGLVDKVGSAASGMTAAVGA